MSSRSWGENFYSPGDCALMTGLFSSRDFSTRQDLSLIGGTTVSEEKTQGAENKPSDQPKAEKAAKKEPKAAGKNPAESKSKSDVKAERPSPKVPVAADGEGTLWMSRRNFFSRAGWVAFFSFCASFLIGSLRFMFPRVLFEPSPVFKAGYPDEYPLGAVVTKWVKEQRVWIVRSEEGIYAIFAQCTHLGCTPRWLDAEGKFKCPCHGSGFTREGVNFEGPAPRPLERVKISLAEDGQIIIDKSIRFLEEKGDWGKPGSILVV